MSFKLLKIFSYAVIGSLIVSVVSFSNSFAAELITDTEVFEKAVVLEAVDQNPVTILGTDTQADSQILKVEILSGEYKGQTISFDNDYIQLEQGDVFYARHQTNTLDGLDYWSVSDPYRLDILLILVIVFVLVLAIFGGIQGMRGLASLLGSFFIIFYVLVPGLYSGYNAILISTAVASLIIVFGSYITHGFNKTTSSAVLGMIATVIIVGLGAYYIVHAANLSGFTSDEHTYLNLSVRGQIDMVGLLFGGIMIGLLGVLYDIAIGQAVAIEELCIAGKHLKRSQIYARGLRIGREHIGALVNTLAIAYVGASLPLILLMQSSTTGLAFILNSEIFSTEVVRILVGSIGLVLAVPITTFIATHMLHGKVFERTSEHSHKH